MLVTVLIDSHGHLYPQHDVELWLEQAFLRIKQINPSAYCGVIAVTESDNEGAWHRLVEEPEHPYKIITITDKSAWLFYPQDQHDKEDKEENCLLLLRGRQYNSAEKIEVLAINADFESLDALEPHTKTLAELTATVYEHQGIAIVPWGFGKWTGRRGRVTRKWAEQAERGFIGDNGGRPLKLKSGILDLWRERERLDLAGSDPLNLKGHEKNNMRTVLEVNLSPSVFDGDDPATELLQAISQINTRSPHYRLLANRPSLKEFISDQIRLRL